MAVYSVDSEVTFLSGLCAKDITAYKALAEKMKLPVSEMRIDDTDTTLLHIIFVVATEEASLVPQPDQLVGHFLRALASDGIIAARSNPGVFAQTDADMGRLY